ncbi:upstream stimulatory factor [Diabrotica virgifera virgifera]|uniref:Upstream stimulatory factor n=1 Tax=Diabrotica virgifera virgifera TaxID=50390 RepID=A0A6P7GMZ8_DIAVI|nr:upstream stimulatory factor [Diabrotica virgifera virgifera]
MDILDPLETGESEEVESKIILNEIHIKGQESDEDANGEQLSPQTLLETPDHEVQYALKPTEGNMFTYRVLQVDDSAVETTPHLVATTGAFNNPVPQVIGSNVNGQLYLIGNANEMFATQSGTRAIAPRTTIVDTANNTVVSSINTSIKRRDERRRATHNEVERRRRDKINNWITKLATIIPENCVGETRANGHYDGQSKGGILAKACDYIMDLKTMVEKYENLSRQHNELLSALEMVNSKNSSLERENKELKAILKKNSILYVPNDLS